MIIPRKTEVFFLIPFNETANKKCSQVYFVVFNVKFNNSKWKNDFLFFLLYMVWSSMRGCVYLSREWASLALPSIFFKWLLTVHVFGTMLSSRFREMFPVASRVPTIIQTVEAFLYLFFVFFFFQSSGSEDTFTRLTNQLFGPGRSLEFSSSSSFSLTKDHIEKKKIYIIVQE